MLLNFLYLLNVDFNPDDRLRLTLLKVYLKVSTASNLRNPLSESRGD